MKFAQTEKSMKFAFVTAMLGSFYRQKDKSYETWHSMLVNLHLVLIQILTNAQLDHLQAIT